MKRYINIIWLVILFSCQKDLPVITPINQETPTQQTTQTSYGYKVDVTLKSKDEINYWRDCGVMWDIVVNKFNVLPNGQIGSNFLPQTITGDFNNDGWIDVYNPGIGSYEGKPVEYSQWLIWNPTLKTFESKNLFNDKNIKYFGGNQRRSIAYDINRDGYTDVVIIDLGDDGLNYNGPRPLQPIRIVLSDGKGGYDLKDLNNITSKLMYNHSGDIADLNNDGYPDLVVATGDMYISWGIPNYPYFSDKVDYFNIWDNNNFNKGGGGVYNITIADVNNDGWKDIIEGSNENSKSITSYLPFTLSSRILYNKGKGVFVNDSVTFLPFNTEKTLNNDFRVIDYNNDGLNDIISTGAVDYDNYFFILYIQNKDGSFSSDKTKFTFTINSNNRVKGMTPGYWKAWLILYDFNGDGVKDISYIDAKNFQGELKTKSVFIRTGDKYVEQDFYQYDKFLNSIK